MKAPKSPATIGDCSRGTVALLADARIVRVTGIISGWPLVRESRGETWSEPFVVEPTVKVVNELERARDVTADGDEVDPLTRGALKDAPLWGGK